MKRSLVMILLFLLDGTSVRAEDVIFFRFFSQLSVTEEPLTVGDLGRFIGDAEYHEQTRQLMSEPLSHSAAALIKQSTNHVDRDQIAQALKHQFVAAPVAVRFAGPQRLVVKQRIAVRPSGQVVAEARDFLYRKLPGGVDVDSITYVGDRSPVVPVSGAVKFSMPDISSYQRVAVWLEHELAGRFTLWFNVRGHAEVWALADNVNAGDVVTRGALVRRVVTLSDLPRGALREEPSWGDQRFVINMKRDRLVTSDSLQPLPAVAAGETVRVNSRIGRVMISSVAEAVNEADIGDRVELRSFSSEETFIARVIERGVAEVSATPLTGGY